MSTRTLQSVFEVVDGRLTTPSRFSGDLLDVLGITNVSIDFSSLGDGSLVQRVSASRLELAQVSGHVLRSNGGSNGVFKTNNNLAADVGSEEELLNGGSVTSSHFRTSIVDLLDEVISALNSSLSKSEVRNLDDLVGLVGEDDCVGIKFLREGESEGFNERPALLLQYAEIEK